MCAWRWRGAEAVSDRIVSPENAQAIRDACSEFFPDVAARVNDKEVSDHHAILPTLELEKADVPGLPVGERNILLLVCCKLLCAAEPFVYETVTAALTAADIPSQQRESRCFPRAGHPGDIPFLPEGETGG